MNEENKSYNLGDLRLSNIEILIILLLTSVFWGIGLYSLVDFLKESKEIPGEQFSASFSLFLNSPGSVRSLIAAILPALIAQYYSGFKNKEIYCLRQFIFFSFVTTLFMSFPSYFQGLIGYSMGVGTTALFVANLSWIKYMYNHKADKIKPSESRSGVLWLVWMCWT